MIFYKHLTKHIVFYKDLKERAEWAEEGGKVPSLKQSGLELEHNGNQVHRNVNIIILRAVETRYPLVNPIQSNIIIITTIETVIITTITADMLVCIIQK